MVPEWYLNYLSKLIEMVNKDLSSRQGLIQLLQEYIDETKGFSEAMISGAHWKILRQKRIQLKSLCEQINHRYEEKNGLTGRRRNVPPHGD